MINKLPLAHGQYGGRQAHQSVAAERIEQFRLCFCQYCGLCDNVQNDEAILSAAFQNYLRRPHDLRIRKLPPFTRITRKYHSVSFAIANELDFTLQRREIQFFGRQKGCLNYWDRTLDPNLCSLTHLRSNSSALLPDDCVKPGGMAT